MILEIAARWKESDGHWTTCGIDYEWISYGPPGESDSRGRAPDDPEWAGRKCWYLFGRQWRSDPIPIDDRWRTAR